MRLLELSGILLAGVLTSPHSAFCQASMPWITSITYGQTSSGNITTMDIHVALMQPSVTGFPCPAGGTLTVDPLPLTDADVKSSADSAHVNPLDLKPTAEPGGYVFHLPVGVNLDLPVGWESFTFTVQAHCNGPAQGQQSPSITVRRFATIDPLQVYVVSGEPQWNRSGGQDTLSFTLQSNRAISIQSLYIRDAVNGNSVNPIPFTDPFDATKHVITLQTSSLTGSHQYKYDVQFTSGGLSVTPSQPLPLINLPGLPTEDYAFVQAPTQAQLTINDASQDFSFTIGTSDSGSLSLVFDTLQINGSNIVNSTSGMNHTFHVAKNDFPPDGQYSVHFIGTRDGDSAKFSDPHEYVLIVKTKTSLKGPIGLSLDNSNNIVVNYCLSQKVLNEVRISSTNSPTATFVGAEGKPWLDGTTTCSAGAFPMTASLPLNDFSEKIPNPSESSTKAKPGQSSSPAELPIQLYILDTTSAPQILSTLNLSAVFLSTKDTSQVSGALNTLATSKDQSSIDSATDALKKYGLDQTTIDTLVKASKKTNGTASAIGTFLGVFGKSFTAAYLGIPAAATTAAASAATAVKK